MKDAIKEIKNTFKRFLSILLVVLLGVGFFAGIKATSPDMKKTIDKYFDDEDIMDIQVISTLGLTDEDINTLKNVEGVKKVVGGYSQDAIVSIGEEDAVIKMETITDEMNKIILIDGKMPENTNECVVERSFLSWTGHSIGDTITIKADKITDDDGNEKELLKQNTMKIVGVVQSPLYLSSERGSSKLGSGKINYYMYITPDVINSDIYTNVYIQVNGAKDLDCSKKQYEDLIDNTKNKIEDISDERKQARYDKLYGEANNKIQDANEKLKREKEKADKEIKDAQKKLDDAKEEIENGKKELAENRKNADTEFANAENKLKNAQEELKKQEEEFNTAKQEAQKQINANQETLNNLKGIQSKYNLAKNSLEQKQTKLEKLQDRLNMLNPDTDGEEILKINEQIARISQEIYVLNATIAGIEDNLKNQGLSISSLSQAITKLDNGIKQAQKELSDNENKLREAKNELQLQKNRIQEEKENAYAKLNSAQEELNNAEKKIKENEKKLEDAKNEANKEIADAQDKLEEAKIKLDDIKKPEWYVLDRNQNSGYVSYMQDTDRIAKIATVFPVVFFVVAALISLTSMSRMVEEQRVQIGTLKALGYTKMQIASKYIIYALLATIVGAIIGLLIGFNILPKIITDMYRMMYTIPKIILEFNIQYALIGTGVAMICTVGATIYSCRRELTNMPAVLMRPKSPKAGKRVFIEKIPFIWKRFSFTQKVTARNIFRYKKRFLMTIIGVMGCTALILAGFGLKDAVGQMIPLQYGSIFKYDVQISLKDNITTTKINEQANKITNMEQFTGILKVNMQSIEVTSIENTQNIQLIVPESTEDFDEYIKLRSRVNRNKTYSLQDEGIVVTEKLAKLLKLKEGDNIKLKNADDIEVETKVEHITENYLMHYIYMSPELYKKLYGEDIRVNTIFANTIDLSQEEENDLGAKVLEDKEYTAGITFISSTQDIFSEVMNNMNFVVWVLIIAAGLLAFVVLYNLSNTNISERIRELATIKVLGFYDKEVYDYISRETIILTLIGMLLGLGAGVFLTMFIIKTCELDVLMFDTRIYWASYIYAMLITIFFATIVNIATYFALKKIDMIESLKSVE